MQYEGTCLYTCPLWIVGSNVRFVLLWRDVQSCLPSLLHATRCLPFFLFFFFLLWDRVCVQFQCCFETRRLPVLLGPKASRAGRQILRTELSRYVQWSPAPSPADSSVLDRTFHIQVRYEHFEDLTVKFSNFDRKQGVLTDKC